MSTDNARRAGFTASQDVMTQMLGRVQNDVFSVIHRHCLMKDELCRASQETLANLIGYSPRTVRREIAKLKKRKFITEIAHQAGGKVNVYVVNREIVEEATLVYLNGRPESPTASENVDPEDEKGERSARESYLVGQGVLPGRPESPTATGERSARESDKDTIFKDTNKETKKETKNPLLRNLRISKPLTPDQRHALEEARNADYSGDSREHISAEELQARINAEDRGKKRYRRREMRELGSV
jgi:DNA-binding MarR family transcriptional regulator